jgi:hypothetical protein
MTFLKWKQFYEIAVIQQLQKKGLAPKDIHIKPMKAKLGKYVILIC